jgi:hypothetical protein
MGTANMRAFNSTRAWNGRRQPGALAAAALAAFFVVSPAAAASSAEETDPAATGSIDRAAAHEVRIRQTKAGREGLELSARLAEDGGIITLPVSWSVANADGETVYREKTPVADMLLGPGDYTITVRYGTVTVEEAVTLLEAQQLGVTFTLNVGGIRVLPRLQGLGLPAAHSETAIYALSGAAKGKRVATSKLPGEIIRVGSGAYRVETRFIPGNAVATADIVVSPGLMSAVEIDHAAGLARLSLADPSPAKVDWTISDAEGKSLPAIAGLSADVVLKPGAYTARAMIDGEERAAAFRIEAGKTQSVIIAN